MIIKKFHEHLVYSDDIIKKAIIKLQKLKIKICLVVDKNKKYIGTLTDGDIRRGLLVNLTIQDKIKDVCNKKSVFTKKKIKEGKIKEILALKKISFFPIINKNKKVIGVYHFTDGNNLEIIKNEMLIMAGGKGKRLRPFTKKTPKPLLLINGVPIIERIIIIAKKQGIKNFVISINYLGKKIKSYLKDGKKLGVNIRYISEDKPLGTAGSLYYFKDSKLPFIVANADVISNINYREMLKYHRKLNSYITVGAINNFEKNLYGNIIFNKNRVKRIEEKVEKKLFINSGIYVVNPNIDKFFKSKKFFHMTEFIELAISQKKKVHIFPIHENWDDYGIKEKYMNKR